MTKKHFVSAAAIVWNIHKGEWTSEIPSWANYRRLLLVVDDEEADYRYTQAVQTAEAFILLFSAENPRFDTSRFLVACGLAAKPVKKGKR